MNLIRKSFKIYLNGPPLLLFRVAFGANVDSTASKIISVTFAIIVVVAGSSSSKNDAVIGDSIVMLVTVVVVVVVDVNIDSIFFSRDSLKGSSIMGNVA